VNLIFAATQGPIAVREASREANRAASELMHTSRHPFAEHAAHA
jgi:hypothetical protein